MKLQSRLFLLAIFMSVTTIVCAQDKTPVNFDKITVQDFSLEGINVDTSYGAVILAEVGKSSFVANKKGFFSIVFKYQGRIKILNQKAFDIATVKIPLYKSVKTDDEETLESLKASTYNIVDGKIVETELDKSNVYKEVQDKNHVIRKFTMPAIKEGSVIDISYTINSDFLFNLQPWVFQGSYPRLWSEYDLNLPEFFEYVFLSKGSHPLHLNDHKKKYQTYNVRIPSDNPTLMNDEIVSLNSTNTINRWVMKDVPALKEEKFTSSLGNHTARIEFQMSGQKFPNTPHRDIMGSWSKACLELMKDVEFGGRFKESGKWFSEAMAGLKLEGKQPMEKAKTIYSYIQKNFSSKGMKGIYTSQPLKETFVSKKGYVPDINLLLTLFLKKADMDVYPVLISTRANGFATEQFPLLNQYNYVVSKLQFNNEVYYLDASQSFLGFGKLPQYCYNGAGALIDFLHTSEPLYADSITEQKMTNIILLNDEKNKNLWVGNFMSSLGYYESYAIKDEIQEKGKDAYQKKLAENYSGDLSIEDISIQELDNNEKPILMNYVLKINRAEDNEIIYFNPMIKEGLKENYFKSEERKYPVELPYRINEIYTFHIQVPEGYVVDEVPKSVRVSLNETDGSFEYIVSKSNEDVSLRTQIKINKSIFMNDEYESLRNFFDYIVKKHAEQIVFKKKS